MQIILPTLNLKPAAYPLFFATLLLILASCSTTRPIAEPTEEFPHTLSPDPEDESLAIIQNLCPFGKPVMGSSYQDEPLTLIVREGYAIKHHDRRKTPVYVCEQLKFEDVHGSLTGRNSWRSDPELCETANGACDRGAVDSDYVGSGWDRGHLAPNMNQRSDEKRKRENVRVTVSNNVCQCFFKIVSHYLEVLLSSFRLVLTVLCMVSCVVKQLI